MQGSNSSRSVDVSSSSDISSTQIANQLQLDISRRNVLRSIFMGLGATALPAWWSPDLFAAGGPELDIPYGPLAAQDYGPLVLQTVGDNLPGVSHSLYAPAGFNVRVVARAGVNPVTKTAEGVLCHINCDGGAVFPHPTDGGWVYASNSETTPGGVGAVRFAADGTVTDYYRILANTRNNCAGGATPWGTWLSCEEVSTGYVFECQPFGTAEQAVRKDALGSRPGREAVAIDPINHVCYQTLDSGNQPFVRFVSNPDDLEVLPNGVTRMRLESGVSQRLHIPAFNSLPALTNVGIANTAAGSQTLRQARPIQWVTDVAGTATLFNGGEGIWYYEVPEALRTIPSAGTVPTRGLIFFTTKNDGRVFAVDIENNLIELIVDGQNGQAFTNLRNSNGALSNWNQVDNLVVSPSGDAMVAEDGDSMRLAIVINNQPSKLLMQITRGGSEICGPAFHPDGSRLYFSSQRGPSGVTGTGASGTIYEMTIPPAFRSIQKADAFSFVERANVAPSTVVTSEPVTVGGFLGKLTVSVSLVNAAQFSIDSGAWTNVPTLIEAGQSLRVRHTSSATSDAALETTVAIASLSPVSRQATTFRTVTTSLDRTPDAFGFGTQTAVEPGALVESMVITPAGFNTPIQIAPSTGIQYRIDGGAYTGSVGALSPGQTLQVRHTASSSPLAYTKTSLKLGGVTGFFTTRTRP